LHIDEMEDWAIGRLEEFIPQEKRGTTCAGYFSALLANAKAEKENGWEWVMEGSLE
jgi:hypothetical protein